MANIQASNIENVHEESKKNPFVRLTRKGVSSFKSTIRNTYKNLKTFVDNFKKTNTNYNNFVLVKSSKELRPGSKIFLGTCIVIKGCKDLYLHANILDGTYFVVRSAKKLNPDSKTIDKTYKVVKNVKDFYKKAKLPYKMFLSFFFSWTDALSYGLILVTGNVFKSFDKFVKNKMRQIEPKEVAEKSSGKETKLCTSSKI